MKNNGVRGRVEKKNRSFPETDNQGGCEGTGGGRGLPPHRAWEGPWDGHRPESPPPPHCHNKQQGGQNGQANGRVSGKRVAAGSVVHPPHPRSGPGQCRAGVDMARAGVQLRTGSVTPKGAPGW